MLSNQSQKTEIQIINDFNELAKIKAKWNSLVLSSLHPNPFLSWEWLETWFEKNTKKTKIFVIVVKKSSEIFGILPTRLTPIKISPKSSIYSLTWPGTGNDLSPDYIGPIVKTGNEIETYHLLFSYLAELKSKLIFLSLKDTYIPDHCINSIKNALSEKYSLKISESAVCPYFKLPISYNDFIQNLSKNRRKKIRRISKKIENGNNVKFEIFAGRSEIEKGFKIIREVSKETKYKAFDNTGFYNFHLSLAQKMSAQNSSRIYVLRFENQPIAYIYGFLFKNKFFDYQTGFDYRFRDFSPGHYILQEVIKKLIDENVSEYDFLKGDERYKYFYAETDRQLKHIAIYPEGMKFSIINRLWKTCSRIQYQIKNIAKKQLRNP